MRIILADGDSAVRRALRVLLTQDLRAEVVGETETLAELQRLVQRRRPDLLVVAWNLVASRPEAALAELRRRCAGLRVCVLGLRPETRKPALAAGADAFASKVDAPDDVLRALRTAAGSATREGAPGEGVGHVTFEESRRRA